MNTDVEFAAEHVMGFERGHCRGTYGGGNINRESCETWQWCDWCHREIRIGDVKPCPKYPFPSFSLVDLMRRLGENGVPIMVRFDVLRTTKRFTIVGPEGRICDTDTPLDSICFHLAKPYRESES